MSETATLTVGARRRRYKAGRWRPMRCRSSQDSRSSTGYGWIRANHDPVAGDPVRCINANACKECMMDLRRRDGLRCTRLEPREMTVKPLSNKALVRDLVTEIAPPAERFKGY